MSDEKAQWEVGDHLEAMWEDGNYYRSEVTEVLQGGKYEVMFVEYSEKATVTFEQMRPLQGLLPFTSSTPSAASHPSSSTSNPFPFASAVANAHTQARTASMDFDYTLKGLRKKPVTEGAPFGNLSLTRGFDKASHLEPVIDRQCKGGLRLMREMAQYLQKLGHLQMSFADSFQKLNQIEHTKRDELRQEDGMPGYVDAYFLLQNAFTDSGLSHRKFATMIQSDIAEYLLRTATEQEKILKASALEEQKANTLLQQRLQAMQSAYKAANVAWKNLCAQQKSRNTTKIPAAQRAAHEKFLRLEESRSAYFAEQTNYAAKLATHLRNLEGIESARMQALQAALTKFKEHEEKCLNQQEILKVFVDYISQITTAQDAIDSLVGKWLNIYGAFPRYVVPACELPCSASMLADGESKWVELAQEEVLLPLPIPSSSSSSAMPSVESLSPIAAASASSPTSSSSSSSAAFLSTPATAEERKRQPSMRNLIRVAVSKKKIRYNKKGFDLDLTYVLDNLISMGFPAEGLQGQYRNPLTEVQRFFNQEHPKNYKVYNLCSELSYDPKKFEDRVARYAFDDHCPPPLELMDPFCRDVHQWLTESPTHVAAVHCKAGKGRTGLMCSCYLLYCGLASTPEAALRHFAVKRTANAKGVTIPSQMRYVWYYSRILAQEVLPVYQPLVVKQIVIHGVPWDVKSAEALALNLQTQERKEDGVILKDIFSSKSTGVLGVWSSPFDCLIYAAENESAGLCVVSGDVCLKISGAAKCRLWFNTRFVKLDENGEGRAVFHKSEIDSALKDVNHDIFPEHFQVVFNVRAVGPQSE